MPPIKKFMLINATLTQFMYHELTENDIAKLGNLQNFEIANISLADGIVWLNKPNWLGVDPRVFEYYVDWCRANQGS